MRLDLTPDALPNFRPDPAYGPAEVVRIQLAALQHNAQLPDDGGVRITFQFASPANRRVTGPIERFIQMVKNPIYGLMLNHVRAELGPSLVVGDRAQQRVTLVGADGAAAHYVFSLSKQSDPPYADCWMTDAVMQDSGEDSSEERFAPAQLN
jgi:hypothetical protein